MNLVFLGKVNSDLIMLPNHVLVRKLAIDLIIPSGELMSAHNICVCGHIYLFLLDLVGS